MASRYHYTECGLDNVVIEGVSFVKDQADDETIVIPAIGALHKVIAEGIVTQPSKMNGKELRFLRSEMGMTQEMLAELLKVTVLTIGRWERGESPIKDTAEMLVRLRAVEALKLGVKLSVDSVSKHVTLGAQKAEIRINHAGHSRYELLVA